VSLHRTPSQTVGPYFAIALGRRGEHVLAPDGIELVGRLLDGRGDAVPDGLVEVWDAAGTRWGRCGTETGKFSFLVPREAECLDVLVFARGLLRHQRTRIYLAAVDDPVLAALLPEERSTLVATREGERLRHDIHLQGERQTVFFAQ
jgi:protocatechuate 3,4-dioxygenase alpha subunit